MSENAAHRLSLSLDSTFGSGLARQEAFREAVSTSMDVTFDRCEPKEFYAHIELLRLGEIGIGSLKAAPHTAYRSARTVKRVGIGLYYLDVFTTAGFSGEMRGKAISVANGDCVVFDQKSTMRLDLGHFSCVLLVIPQPVLEERVTDMLNLDGLVLRQAAPAARLLRGTLELALEVAPSLDPSLAAALGLNLVDLAISCLQPTPESWGRGGDTTARRPRPHHLLPRIQRFVESHIADPALGLDMLCARFAVSRSALYRLFEALGGIQAYILSRRAAAARRLIVGKGADLRLSEVAAKTGFGDERALRRAMQRQYGQSPREIRMAVGGEATDAPPKDDTGARDTASFFDTF